MRTMIERLHVIDGEIQRIVAGILHHEGECTSEFSDQLLLNWSCKICIFLLTCFVLFSRLGDSFLKCQQF